MAIKGVKDTAIALSKINDATLLNTDGAKRIDDMANAVSSLTKEQALLALSTANVSAEDQKAILVKAELITQEEADTVATTADTVAKTANFSITNLLKIAWEKLTAAMYANPLVAITAAVIGIGTAIYGMVKSIENAREEAKEFGESLKNLANEIKDFRTQAEKLNETINDNTSSIEDVATARSNLLDLQDQLIEKYGTEADTIKLITAAINGEADAWEKLVKKEYDALVAEYDKNTNHWSNFFNGGNLFTSKNSEVAIDQMENVTKDLVRGIRNLTEEQQDIFYNFAKQLDTVYLDSGSGTYILSGNAYAVQKDYEKLISFVESAFNTDENNINAYLQILNSIKGEVDDVTDSYGDFYDQYILYNKILSDDNGYADNYKQIIDAYSAYQEAYNSNDPEAITEATTKFSDAISAAMKEAYDNEDWGVIEYFKNMYPVLYAEISSWKFDVDFEGHIAIEDSNGNSTTVEEILNEAAKQFSGMSVEEIEAGNLSGEWTEDQIKAYNDLNILMGIYQCNLDDVIQKMKSIGLYIPTMLDQEALNKIDEIVGRANSDSANSYYETADSEEQPIMQTEEFIEALKVQRDEIENGTRDAYDYAEAISIASKALSDLDSFSDFSISDVFALKDAEDNATALSNLSNQLSEIEDAYNTCLAAKEEYDEQGYLSIDTLQKVLSLGDEYLQYLFDEEGNVSLDAEAFQQLALARINDMETQALCNLAKNIQQITDETTATDYLKQKQNELANSYTDVAASALLALSSIDGFSNSTALQNAYSSFKTQYEQIKSLFASTRNGLEDSFSGISDSAAKAAEDADQATKDYIEAYMKFQEKSLEAGKIGYQTYCNSVSQLLNSMYKDGKISAQDYHNYIGQLLDEQLSVYDKALSAVTRRIDKEIDGIEAVISSIEKQNDALQNQLNDYDSILSVVDSVYEAEIDRIKAEQDAIQDTIDALQDENDERELALQLEQAKYDLYRAQTQRAKKVFNGTEFVYETDQDAIREAQENLADLTLEQTVSGLEAEKAALDSVIEELEYYQSLWAEISAVKETEENRQLAIALWGGNYESLLLSNRISDINAFKDSYISIQDQINDNEGLIASYEEKIEYYEALKEQWSSISDAYEQAQEDQYAAMLLGQDWEAEVLSGRTDTLNQFKDDYISIQQAIIDAAWASANEQVKAAKEAEKAAAGLTGSAPSLESNSDSTTYKIIDTATGGTLVYSSTSEGTAAQKLAALNACEPDQGRYYIKKYASGTARARRGVNLVGENGTETFIDNDGNIALVTQPTLIPMEGGETVKNAAETKSLLDRDNLVPVETFELPGIHGETMRVTAEELQQRVLSVMAGYPGIVRPPMVQTSMYGSVPAGRDNSVKIEIGDIHLHEVQKVDTLAKDIVMELPNKVIQRLGKR